MVTERGLCGLAFGGEDEQEIVLEPKHVFRVRAQRGERRSAARVGPKHVTRLLLELERVRDEAPRHVALLLAGAERAHGRELARERVPIVKQRAVRRVRRTREGAAQLVRVTAARLDLEPAARD